MLHSDFVKPQYDGSCFSSIPQNIRYFLTGKPPFLRFPGIPEAFFQQYKNVMFFFIDSFGWRFFTQHCDHSPFLQRIIEQGGSTKITSQFPSTTASHVTTIHTGLEVGQSGIFEWQIYDPHLDQIIVPLLFSYAGTMERETLKQEGIEAKHLFSFQTLYQDLQQHEVISHVLQHREYTPSPYSDVVFQGAQAIPYLTLPEALTHLEELLFQQESSAYFCLYFDRIDAICHRYGPQSPQLEAEIALFLAAMEHWFQRLCQKNLKDTLFILSADHGQIETDPQKTIYLNQDPAFAGFEHYIKPNQKGELLVPGGGCRDLVLYIKEGKIEAAQAFLETRLAGRAEVYQSKDLIADGLFGALPPSPSFLSRMGDLVILPHPYETVWWYEKGKFEQTLLGRHGGLSPQEMEIPLLLYSF